jgi:PAS domain S-box-containing protein
VEDRSKETALLRGVQWLAGGLAAASVLLGLGLILAWAAARAGEIPGVTPVYWGCPYCGCALVLGGAGLLCHLAIPSAARAWWPAALLSAGTALASAAAIARQWPGDGAGLWAALQQPERMPLVCTGYLLAATGLCLLVGERRRGPRWSEWPAAFALLFALSGLLQLMVDPRLEQVSGRAPSLLGLLLFAVAVLIAEPQRGYFGLVAQPGPGGVMARWLLLPGLVLALGIAVLRWQGEAQGYYGQWFGIVASTAIAMVAVSSLVLGIGWRVQRLDGARDRSERDLRDAQDLFRSAFDSSALGMALVAPEGRILRVNTALCQMLGYSAGELVARGFQEITHPDDLDRDLEYVRQVLAGTLPSFQMEKRYLHREGHVVWGLLTASLVRDPAGVPLHFVSQVQNITRQREDQARLRGAHDALQRSTGLLEAVINSTTDLISALDHDFNYLAINRACADEIEAVYGFRPGAGTNLLAPLEGNPEEQRAVAGLWARGLAGEHFTFEGAFGDPARARRTYELTLAPVRSAAGEILGASLVGRDISQRKHAETQLRQRESEFRTLLDLAPEAMVAIDARGVIRLLNTEAERLFGEPRESLLGRPVGPLLPGVALAGLMERLQQAAGTLRLGHDAPFHIQPRDGAATPVEMSLAAIELGGAWLALATLRNVSERERILAALRESEERLGIALRAARMGIWSLVPGDNILTWDAFMGPLFGLPLGQAPLDAEAYWDLVFEEDKARVQETVVTALLCRSEYYDEYRVVWPDGEVHWLSTRGRVYRDTNDVPVRMAGACWDITDRKRDENRLRELADDLGQINADLEQFAYVASHDLQEPLRAVAGCVQILERRYGGVLDDEGREVIGHAVDGARRMQTLIEDLLSYSRVGTRGKVFSRFAVEDALEEALRNLQVARAESAAEIGHGPLPSVVGDRGQVRQLFQNLVANALKFRGAEPPRISIEAERVAGAWQFSVRDNGIGIDPAHAERIFQVFQRLHTRREYPGTGIGLAICRRIVERHGGHIWVESAVGAGAVFHFTLPDREPTE